MKWRDRLAGKRGLKRGRVKLWVMLFLFFNSGKEIQTSNYLVANKNTADTFKLTLNIWIFRKEKEIKKKKKGDP